MSRVTANKEFFKDGHTLMVLLEEYLEKVDFKIKSRRQNHVNLPSRQRVKYLHVDIFACLFVILRFYSNFQKNPTKCLTVWIYRPHDLYGLFWVPTAHKVYQQTTLAGKELTLS